MEKEGKECTFKPNINQYKGKQRVDGASVLDRTKMWQQKREEKLAKEREMREARELDGCTF